MARSDSATMHHEKRRLSARSDHVISNFWHPTCMTHIRSVVHMAADSRMNVEQQFFFMVCETRLLPTNLAQLASSWSDETTSWPTGQQRTQFSGQISIAFAVVFVRERTGRVRQPCILELVPGPVQSGAGRNAHVPVAFVRFPPRLVT